MSNFCEENNYEEFEKSVNKMIKENQKDESINIKGRREYKYIYMKLENFFEKLDELFPYGKEIERKNLMILEDDTLKENRDKIQEGEDFLYLFRNATQYKKFIEKERKIKLKFICEMNNLDEKKENTKLNSFTKNKFLNNFLEYSELNGFSVGLIKRDYSTRKLNGFAEKMIFLLKEDKKNFEILDEFLSILKSGLDVLKIDFLDIRVFESEIDKIKAYEIKEIDKKFENVEIKEKKKYNSQLIFDEWKKNPWTIFSKISISNFFVLAEKIGYSNYKNSLERNKFLYSKKSEKKFSLICNSYYLVLNSVYSDGFMEKASDELLKLFLFLKKEKEIIEQEMRDSFLSTSLYDSEIKKIQTELQKLIEESSKKENHIRKGNPIVDELLSELSEILCRKEVLNNINSTGNIQLEARNLFSKLIRDIETIEENKKIINAIDIYLEFLNKKMGFEIFSILRYVD